MTSAQFHVHRAAAHGKAVKRSLIIWALALSCTAALPGCRTPYPDKLVSPYLDEQVWAVAPLRNESGTSLADGIILADRLTHALDASVQGIYTVPVNRVLSAMTALDVSTIDSPEQALVLCRTMGIDGLVVGTVTAYDPYDPPVYGVNVTLYVTAQPAGSMGSFDPHKDLIGSHTDLTLRQVQAANQPTSASIHMNAAAEDVRAAVRFYAQGRCDPKTALGWERYLKSMELYTQFVSHRLVSELLDRERMRLSRIAAEP
ncbi:MAG: hypothetical protein KAS72_04360 [Phycisphaerales bacterium]|nr:hypothetical protein [Phycisphaerales bacterium]